MEKALSEELRVREAVAADRTLFLQLAHEIWLPTFSPFIEEPRLSILFEGMYGEKALAKVFNNPLYHLYIVYYKNEPKGYMALVKEEDGSYKLDKIYVHPQLQGKGLGTQLMRFALSRASEDNAHKIWLRVNRKNSGAIRLYQREGYKIVRSVDIPAGNGFVYDDYILEKEISKVG